jgi:hypothetical protein
MASGSAELHARPREITKLLGFQEIWLNYQRDNMQEAPAPAIHPLDSTPEGIIDGKPSKAATTAGTGMAEVIILISLAKSSNESPAGMGTDGSVAAEVAVGMPVAEEGVNARGECG